MTELLRAFGLGSKAEEKEVARVLTRLDKDKTPLLMEIEQSHIHFRSVIAVKQGVIVVAKPLGLEAHLKNESVVRFSVPDEPEKDIRLVVSGAHFNLSSGSAIFICKFPTSFSEGSKRKATRFNTSRFNNLHFTSPGLGERFRIVDLSLNGFKLYCHGKLEQLFPIGRRIAPGILHVSKYKTELDAVIPRMHKGSTVGCEIHASEDSAARKYIAHLIKSLQKTEEEKLRSAKL